MEAGACHQLRQLGLGQHRRRLRPAHAHRVLERALQHHLDEQQHDEVEEQRRDHLVDAEADLEERGHQQQHRTGGGTAHEHGRQGERCRQGDDAAAQDDGGQRPGIELALAADVPELGPEGDGGGKAGEDQGRGAGQGLGQREDGADRALHEPGVGREHGRTGPGEREGREDERQDDGRDRGRDARAPAAPAPAAQAA